MGVTRHTAPMAGRWSTAGTYTWTCPAGVFYVLVSGRGGSGGGGRGSPYGRGGGGCTSEVRIIDVVPGMTYNITVGAGGAGRTTDGDPTAGGDTIFGTHVWKGARVPVSQFRAGKPGAYGGRGGDNFDPAAYNRAGWDSAFGSGGVAGNNNGSNLGGCGGGAGDGRGGSGGAAGSGTGNGSAGQSDITNMGGGGGGGGGATSPGTPGNGGAGTDGELWISWYE